MGKKIQAVIFDMDGLMFDTERLSKEAWLEVGEIMGCTITEEIISRFRGGTPEISRKVLTDCFGEEFDYDAARAMRTERMQHRIDREGLPMKPGLTALLDALGQWGMPCAIASSSAPAIVGKYLRISGLGNRFSAVVHAEDVLHSKPAPDCFLLAAERLGILPEHCLVLEDSANGLLGASHAGIRAVCVPDIALPREEALKTAKAVLPSLWDVIGFIERENGCRSSALPANGGEIL